MSSVGEQYVQLLPRSGDGPSLKDGDVIPRDRTSVPTDINEVLDATNSGLQAIPRDNLKTVVDEALHRSRRTRARASSVGHRGHRAVHRRTREP